MGLCIDRQIFVAEGMPHRLMTTICDAVGGRQTAPVYGAFGQRLPVRLRLALGLTFGPDLMAGLASVAARMPALSR